MHTAAPNNFQMYQVSSLECSGPGTHTSLWVLSPNWKSCRSDHWTDNLCQNLPVGTGAVDSKFRDRSNTLMFVTFKNGDKQNRIKTFVWTILLLLWYFSVLEGIRNVCF